MVEKNDLTEYVIIFGVYIWMFASGVIFRNQPEIQRFSNLASIVLMILFVVVKDAYARVESAKYIYAPAVFRPYDQTHRLFLKKQTSGGWVSRKVAGTENLYISTLPLAKPVKNVGHYTELNALTIVHEYPLDKRLLTHDGKCNYNGDIVPHSAVAELVLYEITPEAVGSEDGSPVPVFYLKEAPGDYNIPELRANVPLGYPKVRLKEGKLREVLWKQYYTIRKLMSTITKLQVKAAAKEQQASYWHTAFANERAYVNQLKEEINGLLNSMPKFMTGVVNYAASKIMNIDDIRRLARRGNALLNIDWKHLALMVVGVSAIAMIGLNERLRTQILMFLEKNQAITVILALGGIVSVYYLIKHFIRRKR